MACFRTMLMRRGPSRSGFLNSTPSLQFPLDHAANNRRSRHETKIELLPQPQKPIQHRSHVMEDTTPNHECFQLAKVVLPRPRALTADHPTERTCVWDERPDSHPPPSCTPLRRLESSPFSCGSSGWRLAEYLQQHPPHPRSRHRI